MQLKVGAHNLTIETAKALEITILQYSQYLDLLKCKYAIINEVAVILVSNECRCLNIYYK